MTQQGLVVESVANDSIAAELGVEPGDVVTEIGGQPVRDIIDYRFLISEEELSITLIKSNGEEWILDIEKDFDDDLGVDFGQSGIGNTRRCQNRCMFCFVDQMPPNLRKTLYLCYDFSGFFAIKSAKRKKPLPERGQSDGNNGQGAYSGPQRG